MNRKSFIGRALLGVGAMFSGIKLSAAAAPLSAERQWYIDFLESDWFISRVLHSKMMNNQKVYPDYLDEAMDIIDMIKNPDTNLSDISMTLGLAIHFMRKGHKVKPVGKDGVVYLRGTMMQHEYKKRNGEIGFEESIEAGFGQWEVSPGVFGELASIVGPDLRCKLPEYPVKNKVAIIDWTDDQIREAFKLQFGLDSREVVRIKNMTGDGYGWAIIGGGTVTENGIIRGSFILRSSGDWINAREVGGTGYRVLSDDLRAYISELS